MAISVQSGTNRHYYLAGKGLCPEGIYTRQGYSSFPATNAAIHQIINETDGDSFEEMRSVQQSLTFEGTAKEFALRTIPFGLPQMKTLKLISPDGLYTNLGLILSEQCPHTVKAAVFAGINQNEFQDRRDFSGLLLRQFNEVYEFIYIHNQTHSSYKRLLRMGNHRRRS